MSKIKYQKHPPCRRAGNLKIKSFSLLVLALIFAFCTLHLSEANAQDLLSFTISPPSIKFSLKPGEKAEKTIKITNNTDLPVVFTANVLDFIVTDKTGTPELLPADLRPDNKYAASYWTTVLPDSIPIAPGKTATATLFLQVPGDARPGGRYVSVALRPLAEAFTEGTGSSVNPVAAVLVYLTVQGDMTEGGRVTSFTAPPLSEYGPIDFKAEIIDTGDVHINPKMTIKVKNLFGREVYSTALPSHINVFPGASRIYETTWPRKWLLGRYRADLAGYFGQENNLPLSAMVAFWVIPYKLILIIIALVVSAVVLVNKAKNQPPKEIKEEK